MKKTIFSFLLISSFVSLAQTEQGNILLGGSVGFYSTKSDQSDTTDKVLNTSKYNQLNINLRGGYFFADNLAAGLLLGYNTSKNSTEYFSTPPAKTINEDRMNSIQLGLFARAYTTPTQNRFSLFGEFDFTYNTGKTEKESTSINISGVQTTSTTHDEFNGIGAFVIPGVAFFLSDMVALEATFGAIGFASNTTKEFNTAGRLTGEVKQSRLEATFSPSTLRLGIAFYIGGGDNSGGGK